MTDTIIQFKDGALKVLDTRGEYTSGGCPTCDIGSERINYIEARTTNYKIRAILAQEYGYAITNDRYGLYDDGDITVEAQDVIDILDIKNPEQLTEKQFVSYFIQALLEITNYAVDIRVTGFAMKDFYHYDEEFIG